MGVARHLQIDLAEYDLLIRTFIPHYDQMLEAAAAALGGGERLVVDLGVGTGALAARCLRWAPHARILGVDEDPQMLRAAGRRLGERADLVAASFLRAPIPECDAIVASLALHHVRTRAAKARLYARLRTALRPARVLVSADCHPARDRLQAKRQHEAWLRHLLRSYSPAQASGYFSLWAEEDVYVPLHDEARLLERAGYAVEVIWRRGAFAVIVARRD